MLNLQFKDSEVIKIDLHNMKVWEAELYLSREVSSAPKEIREIVVIHGYHNGTAIMDMVRRDFKNPRVKQKILSLNKGVTSLMLN